MNAAARTSLPVIEIQQPCHESWDAMSGGERSRFCEHCQKHVHDLTTLTAAEADELICRSAGDLCVRFARTEDGKVMTLEYAPTKNRRMSTKRWLAFGTVAALLAGCGNLLWHRRQPPPPVYLAGSILMPVDDAAEPAPPPASDVCILP